MLRPSLIILIPLMLLALLPACRTRDFRTEGDVLRGRVAELEREMAQLERRNRELRAEVERLAAQSEIPDEAAGHVPQVADLAFARFSHARDTSGDGWPNELRLYLHTLDGRGRFTQVTGELTVDAVLVPRDPSIEPVPIGTRTLAPEELRDSFRSGFMGTHYAVRMPVEIPPARIGELSPAEVERILVRAALTDVMTGQTHRADRTLDVREPERARRPERGREEPPRRDPR